MSSWEVSLLVDLADRALFRFTSRLFKNSQIITYWLLEAVYIKKSLIITGIANWHGMKLS